MKILLLILTAALAACSKPKESDSSTSASPRSEIPYAKEVPTMAGFVTSPYAPNSGYIDVRGLQKDAEARDPYTGKMFLVP